MFCYTNSLSTAQQEMAESFQFLHFVTKSLNIILIIFGVLNAVSKKQPLIKYLLSSTNSRQYNIVVSLTNSLFLRILNNLF